MWKHLAFDGLRGKSRRNGKVGEQRPTSCFETLGERDPFWIGEVGPESISVGGAPAVSQKVLGGRKKPEVIPIKMRQGSLRSSRASNGRKRFGQMKFVFGAEKGPKNR